MKSTDITFSITLPVVCFVSLIVKYCLAELVYWADAQLFQTSIRCLFGIYISSNFFFAFAFSSSYAFTSQYPLKVFLRTSSIFVYGCETDYGYMAFLGTF